MSTTTKLRHLVWGALVLGASQAQGQTSVLGNAGTATDFLGWDNTVTNNFPLQVRHDLNQPIDWYTNAIQRMRLNPTQNNTINGFNVSTDGFLGLGPNALPNNTAPILPWTRLHLHDNITLGNAIANGFRPWMRNGITMTGHGDQMYVGHLYGPGPQDPTDAIFQWSDNSGTQNGPDLMRFVFTGAFAGSASGQNSLFGREIMQLHPQGLIGLGDFNAATVALGTQVSPTERLDVLDGRVRVRQLPIDPPNNDLKKILVVEDLDPLDPEYGVIKWRDASTLTADDCDWVQSANWNVVTAYGPGTCPPDQFRGVGIGLQQPKAKLEVFTDCVVSPVPPGTPGSTLDGVTGIRARVLKNLSFGDAMAMDAYAQSLSGTVSSGTITGLRTSAVNGKYTYGVFSDATIPSNASGAGQDVIGVVGSANANNKAARSLGVFGRAFGGITDTYAIWSEGSQFSTTLGTWTTSDEQLKQNIEPQEGAMEILRELRPSTYTFRTEEFPFLGLAEGIQHGLIAQEVEAILPQLVRTVHRPSDLDSVGNPLTPALELKAVNYELLIPIMIAAIQEQEQQINELQQALASCCANPSTGDTRLLTDPAGDLDKAIEGDARSLHIQPNPFTERTTLHYRLERAGRMQLLANSADGKALKVLQEASLEAGAYQFNWVTGDLTPGVYYITLLLDGEPIVKKAVKVDR